MQRLLADAEASKAFVLRYVWPGSSAARSRPRGDLRGGHREAFQHRSQALARVGAGIVGLTGALFDAGRITGRGSPLIAAAAIGPAAVSGIQARCRGTPFRRDAPDDGRRADRRRLTGSCKRLTSGRRAAMPAGAMTAAPGPIFRLAHLTDPHVGPLARPRLSQLLGKRATGYANWRRGRSRSHDMAVLSALVADLRREAPDHIACTGDLCNIGLPSEWETARQFLAELGPPDRVSFVPGNHDAYVRGSLEGLLAACGPWTGGDAGAGGVFPYLRRRGPVALVGLSSAIPTKPFVASGRLGPPQIEAAEALLKALAREPARPVRVVMIHHPPHPGGAAAGRELKDAAAFTAMIGRAGAELILHGHNHIVSLAHMAGPDGAPVPVVGGASASARPGDHCGMLSRRAAYILYEIDGRAGRPAIGARRRGLGAEGVVIDLGPLVLDQGEESPVIRETPAALS